MRRQIGHDVGGGLFGAILATPLLALSIAIGVRLRTERGGEVGEFDPAES